MPAPSTPRPATADRLLDAVEALLAERPEHEITVRDITARAGANVASVGYHFGSRDAVVQAAVRRVLERVTAERRDEVDRLAPDAPLEDVVRAWLGPALAALEQPDRSTPSDWSIIAGVASSSPELLQRAAVDVHPTAETTLVERLATLLPHLDADELRWRHAVTLGLAGLLGSGTPLLPVDPERPDAGERFVTYVVGALRAPPARGA